MLYGLYPHYPPHSNVSQIASFTMRTNIYNKNVIKQQNMTRFATTA